MKRVFKKIAIVICSITLFSCASNPTSSSSSYNLNSISEKEIEDVSKELLKKYETINEVNIYSNNLKLSAIAKYVQTIHVEEYGIVIDKANINLELSNFKNEDIKAFLTLSGDYKTYSSIINRGEIDEDESNEFSFKLNEENIYCDKDSLYASISKDLRSTICEENLDEGIKIYNSFNINDLDKEEIEDDIINIFNPSSYLDPSNILSEITSQTLIKNFLSYTKKNDIYTISLKLNSSNIYTIISDYSNSYASNISLPDKSKFEISISFDKNKIYDLSFFANIHAKVNFDSLGKVDFNYDADGKLLYGEEVQKVNTFQKSDEYIKYSEDVLPINKYLNESSGSIIAIYDQIIALFKN